MDFYLDLLAKILSKGEMGIHFSGMELDADRLVEMKCYEALCKIKAIVEDDAIEDPECFMRVEEIICTLEELGSGGGGRHDFG